MCSQATSAHGVGVAGEPQAYRTENAQFVALVSHVQQFEAYRDQFFTDIYQFVVARIQDLAIFVMMMTDKTDCFTP